MLTDRVWKRPVNNAALYNFTFYSSMFVQRINTNLDGLHTGDDE